MSKLARQRCFTHLEREAAARCPQCSRYFCRECVLEHEGKMVCTDCLRKHGTAQSKGRKVSPSVVVTPLVLILSLLFLWVAFYTAGNLLRRMPDSFHDGSLWKKDWINEGWEDQS